MTEPKQNPSTIRQSFESVARGRYLMPVALALGIVAIGVNEGSYRHANINMRAAMALTDARVQAAETLQLLTDARLYARSYLMTGAPEEAAAYRDTINQMWLVKQETFDLLAKVDSSRALPVDAIDELLNEELTRTGEWVSLMSQGERENAFKVAGSGSGRQRRNELRKEFDTLLSSSAGLQTGTRFTLIRALAMNRWAVHFLAVITIFGMFLFQRQLRKADNLLADERLRLAERVRERTAELSEMATHLVRAREDERAHIARELHDEMGGLLTAIKLDFARLRRMPGLPEKAPERMVSIEQRLNEGIALKRRIIENLRPSSLEQLGLVPALEILCRDMSGSLGVPVHMDLQPVAVGKDAELSLFRVVQESLTNIGKYARAQQVHIRLVQSGMRVRLTVQDDGLGFQPARVTLGRHGLVGMRVRLESHSGQFSVASRPGHGTTITADLPAQLETPTEAA